MIYYIIITNSHTFLYNKRAADNITESCLRKMLKLFLDLAEVIGRPKLMFLAVPPYFDQILITEVVCDNEIHDYVM